LPRNNQRRAKSAATTPEPKAAPTSVLDFVTPTEFVELPSAGLLYAADHPFHNQKNIEINYMTAKDEDILTSQTLLRQGLALERLLENVLSNYDVDPKTLLVGDRNAILIAARTTGYGPIYKTNVTCPSCGVKTKYNFDLTQAKIYSGDNHGDKKIKRTKNGTYVVKLPLTKVDVEMKVMTGVEETQIGDEIREEPSLFESMYTSQLQRLIVSLNDETEPAVINRFVELMPAVDSRFLREANAAVTPNIDLTQQFKCESCDHTQKMGVPFTVDFFWPNR